MATNYSFDRIKKIVISARSKHVHLGIKKGNNFGKKTQNMEFFMDNLKKLS